VTETGGVIDRYEGHILGLGTSDGRRVVVGRWLRSPWPPFVDVMTQDAAGRRTLLAPTRAIADEVGATYRFDDVLVVPTRMTPDEAARTWTVTAGPLVATMTIGERTPVGRLLRAVPRAVSGSTAFATAVDPVARVVLPGVRTRGSAGQGRREWYGAHDQHRVVDARVTWDGVDCGSLVDIEPVDFGFSSVPRRPAVTGVRTTIRR
jgi:hypothetical protein